MPETHPVERALRALATGEAPRGGGNRRPPEDAPAWALEEPAAVVAQADSAFADVRDAAAFVDSGGAEDLRLAVRAAERRGDRATARAGQRLLARLQRYRRVADGAVGEGTTSAPDGERF